MISVVIPTLNEQERLPALLAALGRETPAPEVAPEIIVVDGGSGDATRRLARDAGARVLRAWIVSDIRVVRINSRSIGPVQFHKGIQR